ncbi:hypothetical protein [Hymenobacter sp. UV11]|uniref:hypothetical protein n=1 Tax=Hymenobacter sp. UV11 TaxID=1849735 RepID=UPI00105D773F|nr:hypothetical protein [Hymenobacter sp. UV11]
MTRLLDGLCLTDTYADGLAAYQRAGQSDLRRLVAGVHATHVAWQIRGGAYAKYVGKAQAEGFHKHLEDAFDWLNEPFATPSYEAERAARIVRVAMGMSEPNLAQEAFEHAIQLVPDHLQAHLFYFNVLTPKWFGDEEKLEQFVDVAAASALQPLLQTMYAVELLNNADDGTEIVKQQVRNELAPRLKTLARYTPLPNDTLYAVYFNNYLAGLCHALGQLPTRNTYLEVLSNRITYYPWAYYGLLDASAVQRLAQPTS